MIRQASNRACLWFLLAFLVVGWATTFVPASVRPVNSSPRTALQATCTTLSPSLSPLRSDVYARYYNPAAGRFWTRDTFEGWLDDPASLHPYSYVGNDPVNFIDPSGYFSIAEQVQVTYESAREWIHQNARLARSAWRNREKVCRLIQKGQQAANVAQQVQSAARNTQMLAAFAGTAAGAGLGGAGDTALNIWTELYKDTLIEAYNLKGLEQYELFQKAGIEELQNYGTDASQTPCFTAGTLVSTETGLRPIEQIKVGDKVWAMGRGTTEFALRPVTQTFSNQVHTLVILSRGKPSLAAPASRWFLDLVSRN